MDIISIFIEIEKGTKVIHLLRLKRVNGTFVFIIILVTIGNHLKYLTGFI